MFYAALAFAAGIAAAALGGGLGAVAALAAAGLGLGAAARRWPRWRPTLGAAALLWVAAAGCGWAHWRAAQPARADSLARAVARWERGPRATVVIGGYLRDSPDRIRDYQRFDLQAAYLEAPSGITGVRGAVRVYLDSAEPIPGLTAGRAVELTAHLRPLRRYRDPGVGDFSRAERRAGIDFTASLHPRALRLLAGVPGPWPLRLRAALWASLSTAVDQIAPPARYAGPNALLRGMLLGDNARLDRATRRDFQVDGIYHVLVVAGLHLGILALFLIWLLRGLRLRPQAASLGCLLVLAAYAWVIAGRTPTLRVLLMLTVYFAARYWYRERRPLNAVGVAGCVLLLWRPGDLFAPGFQLSFGAAVLLAGIVAPLLAATTAPRLHALRQLAMPGHDEAFPPHLAAWRASWRRRMARWGRLGATAVPLLLRGAYGLAEVVLVSLVLQWGLSPLMLTYFHRAAPWAGAVNAVVVPAVGVLLPAAWCLAAVAMVFGRVPAPAGHALAGAAGWLLRFAHVAAGWPLAAARTPTPPGWALALFAVAVAAWLWVARRGGRRLGAVTAAVALLAVALAWLPFPPRLPRGLTLTTLDVGQGDSLLVTFPAGRTLLVDAGPKTYSGFNAGHAVVGPYLWSLGLRHLDAVLLTHGHMDHMGGMPFVLRHFLPQELWVTASLPTEPAVQNLLVLARQLRIRICRRYAGERFRVGGTELDVLLPLRSYRAAAHARNRDSMVIRISDGRAAMLLEGDAEAVGEREMLAGGMPLASEVLKVGHHGSRTSSLPAFLAAVNPAAAVISVGAGNLYGLPDGSVLRNLATARAHIFRTDRIGAVQASFTAGRLRVFRFQPIGAR
ncbi:MAG: ComEC/Rec2 family competence protein [Terriglobales bacterium]